ncbi:MAG: hypothetical protein CMB80_22390 [Flammeovirgaceae bacterium]|nr:hypothetical protein [Flammeovirgaceae bacterium]MBE62661.1 hypothetical protein [Flammeovirgaceae bacterium]MBR09830.1 hypothetical protein [Rickettsiales bacterium]HCX22391.1 hypothetical protein [Cytophagales bacterium]|tara:strand:+ start:3287 stop:3691 length:405 start_codon:yes stop_codon:yes gene_type:complete
MSNPTFSGVQCVLKIRLTNPNMRAIYYLFFTVIVVSSCKEESEGVCTSEPFEAYEWLSDIRTNLDNSETVTSITQYVYNDNCVYEVNYGAYVDALVIVYNEQGEEICKFGGIAGFNTCPDFDEKATNEKVIFQK